MSKGKHGHAVSGNKQASITYTSWVSLKGRCNNPNDPSYGRYGALGVSVCDRWNETFNNFLQDVGERPSIEYSADRFPNKNGNYEPGNFRWATHKEQMRNRNVTSFVEYCGQKISLADVCDIHRVDYHRTLARIKRGWSLNRAISEPIRYGGIKTNFIPFSFGHTEQAILNAIKL